MNALISIPYTFEPRYRSKWKPETIAKMVEDDRVQELVNSGTFLGEMLLRKSISPPDQYSRQYMTVCMMNTVIRITKIEARGLSIYVEFEPLPNVHMIFEDANLVPRIASDPEITNPKLITIDIKGVKTHERRVY